MNKKIRIYSNELKTLKIEKLVISYKEKNLLGIRKFILSDFSLDPESKEYYQTVKNVKFNTAVKNNNIEFVDVVLHSKDNKTLINIIDENSLLCIHDIKDDGSTYRLKSLISLKLDIVSENNIDSILSLIESIEYFDDDDNLMMFETMDTQTINNQYYINMIFSIMPRYFKFKFIKTDPKNIDSLVSFDIYQLGKLVIKNTVYRHISKKHYFDTDIHDMTYLLFNFIDVCEVKNINTDVDLNMIDFVRVFYNDNSNYDINDLFTLKDCIYMQTKHGNIQNIEIYWKEAIFSDKPVMIDIYKCDSIKSKYKENLNLSNTEKLKKYSLLQKSTSNDKIKYATKICSGESTFLTFSINSDDNKEMVIHDADVNHLFNTYDFKYFMSYDEGSNINHVYVCPFAFLLDDVNFVGIKYYFYDISKRYKIDVKLHNSNSTKEAKNISITGRSFNAVIPLENNIDNNEKINHKALENLNIYNKVKDLPSEYVKYGRYSPDEELYTPEYIDIDLSLSTTFDGDFNLLHDKQAVMQSLYNLFLSIKHDRPLKPWLEANLRNRVFDIEGNILTHIIRTYIDSYVSQVEPRVKIHTLETKINNNNYNSLNIIIVFSVINTDANLPFSFDIQVEK